MPLFLRVLLLIIASLATTTTARPQSVVAPGGAPGTSGDSLPPDSLAAGMRVRVTTAAPPFRRVGSLFAVSGDTIVFRGDRSGEVLRLPLDHFMSLHVSNGRGITRSRLAAGAVIGLAGGLLLGRIKHEYESGNACAPDCGRESHNLRLGALIGMGAGVIIARVTPGERWRPVRLVVRP